MFNKVKSFLGKVISKAENKIETAKAVMNARAHTVLYALFNDTIMPSVTEKVEGLFNYAG